MTAGRSRRSKVRGVAAAVSSAVDSTALALCRSLFARARPKRASPSRRPRRPSAPAFPRSTGRADAHILAVTPGTNSTPTRSVPEGENSIRCLTLNVCSKPCRSPPTRRTGKAGSPTTIKPPLSSGAIARTSGPIVRLLEALLAGWPPLPHDRMIDGDRAARRARGARARSTFPGAPPRRSATKWRTHRRHQRPRRGGRMQGG